MAGATIFHPYRDFGFLARVLQGCKNHANSLGTLSVGYHFQRRLRLAGEFRLLWRTSSRLLGLNNLPPDNGQHIKLTSDRVYSGHVVLITVMGQPRTKTTFLHAKALGCHRVSDYYLGSSASPREKKFLAVSLGFGLTSPCFIG